MTSKKKLKQEIEDLTERLIESTLLLTEGLLIIVSRDSQLMIARKTMKTANQNMDDTPSGILITRLLEAGMIEMDKIEKNLQETQEEIHKAMEDCSE